ncbi:MAG: hypothetical protein AAGC88_16065, partial [Bacteroidota bacterium]
MIKYSGVLNFTHHLISSMGQEHSVLRYILSLVICFIVMQSAVADRSKKALKELTEGDYRGAIESLAKSIEKDTINTSAYYVYALLFSTSEFSGYKVDSARYYVLRSLKDYNRSDDKQLKELEKLERDLEDIMLLKSQIDELAFSEALDKNSIQGYEYFMNRYTDAEQFNDAEKRRNTLVYAVVSRNDTWQAYEAFFLKYPSAIEAPSARDRYELLLFQDRTRANTLSAYSQFLIDFPETPYRKKSEQRILKIMAADNEVESFSAFLDRYPETQWHREVANRLYHLSLTAGVELAKHLRPFADSLRSSARLDSIPLLTIYDDSTYGFINYEGEEVYPP